MKHSLKVGFSFGLTSGIITTLGLIVGLYIGTQSKVAVLGGIFTIAIADALSDALGIHVSEESEGKHTQTEIWESTISTFITKFFFALTFILPVLFLDLSYAVLSSVVWGIVAIAVLSFYIAKNEREKPWKVVMEHILITLLVIAASHTVGMWVSSTFGG